MQRHHGPTHAVHTYCQGHDARPHMGSRQLMKCTFLIVWCTAQATVRMLSVFCDNATLIVTDCFFERVVCRESMDVLNPTELNYIRYFCPTNSATTSGHQG
eukprot:2803419-Pyramimonas_sp.AAC.1